MDEGTKEILGFIVHMTGHLAWPVAIFAIFFALKPQLIKLVKEVKKAELEGPGGVVARVEWGGEVADVPPIKVDEKPPRPQF